jgi:hypothetical protein
MMRYWRVFSALVLARPLVLVLILMFPAVAAAVVLSGLAPAIWPVLVVLLALPALMLFALTTERMIVRCTSAGELGIPRHVETVRGIQALLLIGVVAVPITLAAANGGTLLSAAAAITGAAALGTMLNRTGLLILIGLVIVTNLLSRNGDWSWLTRPWVQSAILALGAIQLVRWWMLPGKIESNAPKPATRFADAAHVSLAPASGPVEGGNETPSAQPPLDAQILHELRDVRSGASFDAALALGLGSLIRGNRARNLLQGTALLISMVLLWHFVHGRYDERWGYFAAVAISAISLGARIAVIHDAWKRSPATQELLLLLPSWPSREAFKKRMAGVLLRSQLGGWMVWTVYSSAALLIGAVTRWDVLLAAEILFALSCADIAAFAALLARRSVGEIHLSSIAILLTGVAGVAMLRLPGAAPWGAFAGIALIVLPLALALLAMFRRPLLFPVVRKIKVERGRA